MNDRILQTLHALRRYALEKAGCEIAIFYHEENSFLMRFANSAISLNTNERLIRLDITAFSGNKRASVGLITDLNQLDVMKKGIDDAAALVEHMQPLNYPPTIPLFSESYADESNFDPSLVEMSNEDRLEFVNQAAQGLETEAIKLSGIFSSGANIIAQINTRSEHTQYFATSDAQVTLVLAHNTLKWEITAEQSAHQRAALDAAALHGELALLREHYLHDTPLQLPLGKYDIVFGSAAIADLINFMNFIGFNGGLMKRGFSFLSEAQVGQKVFSSQFTLADDPSRPETFPFRRDFTGMPRNRYPLVTEGVFEGFVWFQDDADEYGARPTGHTVSHRSVALQPGSQPVNTLEELIHMPRERDILYIPFLHYMNIVNPSKGVLTASSRFGALLLKKDGSVMTPYNVRLTQSLLDVFGEKVAWLSQKQVAYNTSMSYGARNPTAILVPAFMQVNDLEISHSNTSY